MSLLCKKKAAKLERLLQTIANSNIQKLREMWEAVKKEPAPKPLSARVLRYVLAWQHQAKAHGGETAEAKTAWLAIEKLRACGTGGDDLLSAEPHTPRTLPKGARLVRSWRGATHEVECVQDGYRWQGQTYRSLSAIAKAITGSNRNGPAFFGLRSKEGIPQ